MSEYSMNAKNESAASIKSQSMTATTPLHDAAIKNALMSVSYMGTGGTDPNMQNYNTASDPAGPLRSIPVGGSKLRNVKRKSAG